MTSDAAINNWKKRLQVFLKLSFLISKMLRDTRFVKCPRKLKHIETKVLVNK